MQTKKQPSNLKLKHAHSMLWIKTISIETEMKYPFYIDWVQLYFHKFTKVLTKIIDRESYKMQKKKICFIDVVCLISLYFQCNFQWWFLFQCEMVRIRWQQYLKVRLRFVNGEWERMLSLCVAGYLAEKSERCVFVPI